MQGFKFEEAMRLLVSHFPKETKKPALFHSMRVWAYLRNNNYSEDIQIAWLLHDALEDTDITAEKIEELFWKKVLQIIQVNTKNTSLDRSVIREDLINRCVEWWENALIVKMADVYDNYNFYTKQNNIRELENSTVFSTLILKHKKENWNDPIFERAHEILNNK